MASTIPYEQDANVNAVFLLQKQVFQYQASCLSELTRGAASTKIFINAELKVPNFILSRSLPDELVFQGRSVDNEELTLLGFLDANGDLSCNSRLNEFMLFMTRIKRAEHRALCVHVVASRATEETKKNFVRFGGLRIVKRWLRSAEEGDNVQELIALVDLCQKVPFDEVAIREVGIGKVIKKLLKYHSPSGGDVAALQSQIESLIALWRTKQKEATAAKEKEEPAPGAAKPQSELVLAISERLLAQRGRPELSNDSQRALQAAFERLDSNESKSEMPEANQRATPKFSFLNAFSMLGHGNGVGSGAGAGAGARHPTAGHPDGSASGVGASDLTAAAGGGAMPVPSTVTPIKAPAIARERKPLDMAEGARKLLAMRAQQASAGGATSPGGSAGDAGAGSLLSPSASSVLSILSAVGKARTASGLAASVHQAPAVPLKSALKKPKTTTSAEASGTTGGDADKSAIEAGTDSAAAADGGAKKGKKKGIHWADEGGGLLREVQIIEVAKIKRSTADYSNTRELSKRERLAEKEAHVAKTEDAMQRNTEWRTPQPLALSIVVLDNISIVADSAEKAIQENRLAHILEIRYHDDSQIPADPDESPSVNEPSSSSILGGRGDLGTGAGDDTSCSAIPWYQPGTEPPPEELAPPPEALAYDHNGHHLGGYGVPSMAQGPGGYADDTAPGSAFAQLPYSLQTLDPHTLRILTQDPALVQSILRPDGSVDEINLAAFKRSVGAIDYAHGPHGAAHFAPEGPRYGDAGQRRSRWGGGAEAPIDPYRAVPDPYARSMPGPALAPAPAPYEFDYDYDPYGPPRGGGGAGGPPVYGDRPPAHGPHGGWNGDYDEPLGPVGGRPPDLQPAGGRSGPGQRRFPTTKASTPCRFFNTAKGCQFGDKCAFGHFLGVSSLNDLQHVTGAVDQYAPPAGLPDRGTQWSAPGAGAGPSPAAGPGRNSRFGGPGRAGPGSMVGAPGSLPPPTFLPPPAAGPPGTMPAPADFVGELPRPEEHEVKRKRRFH